MARVTGPARGLFDGLRQLAITQREVQITMAQKPRAPREDWHEVGTTGEPSFLNGWTNRDIYNTSAAFYRDPNGFVHLKGNILGPVDTNINQYDIFYLPAGYRPTQHHKIGGAGVSYFRFIDGTGNSRRVSVPSGLFIYTSGLVKANPEGYADGLSLPLSLDSVVFRADLSVDVG